MTLGRCRHEDQTVTMGWALNVEIENGRRLLDNPLSGQGSKAAR
jgi:hypothetical protein